jgi:hypothetical protein
MKKVLKLILVVAMLSALSISAFASPVTESVADNSGASELAGVSMTYDPANTAGEIVLEVVAPTDSAASENESYAEQQAAAAGTEILKVFDSFDANLIKDGEKVHEGASAQFTFNTAGYEGKAINLIENSDNAAPVVAASQVITGPTTTLTVSSFSTFTAVITEAPMGSATSPQTSQSMLPATLACVAVMALAGVVFSATRKFN